MFPTLQKDAAIAADPAEGRAALIAKLRGEAPYITLREDMDALSGRNRALLSNGSQGVRAELVASVPVLEALMYRFASDSAKAGPAATRQSLASVALSAQKVLLANLMALHRTYQDEADSKALPIQPSRED